MSVEVKSASPVTSSPRAETSPAALTAVAADGAEEVDAPSEEVRVAEADERHRRARRLGLDEHVEPMPVVVTERFGVSIVQANGPGADVARPLR